MFAIVEVGARQYKVGKGDIFDIFRISHKKEVSLDKVLMIVSGKETAVGGPYLKGAKVTCEVIGDIKGRKKIAFKFKRRKSYHRKIGHRDQLTRLKVKEISKATTYGAQRT